MKQPLNSNFKYFSSPNPVFRPHRTWQPQTTVARLHVPSVQPQLLGGQPYLKACILQGLFPKGWQAVSEWNRKRRKEIR